MTMTKPASAPRTELTKLRQDLPFAMLNHGMIVVFVLLVIVSAVADPQFLTPTNLWNMLLQWAPVGLMAVGMTYVIIAGGFDLSVGGVYAGAAVLFAGLTNAVGILPALVITLAAGTCVGLVNGIIVTGLQVNPFVTTLGTGFVVRGLALVATGATPILVMKDGFDWLGSGYVLGAPVPAILLVLALLLGGFVLRFTVFGRGVFAVGGGEEAARLSGVPVKPVRTFTYVITGFLAALAGMILASRLGTGQADVGANIELDVITVVVVGGTALAGGEGAMWRTAVGIGLLAVLGNSFDRLQISPFWQLVIKGLIVVLAVAVDSYGRRHRKALRVK
jgi:ribose transport system permease protein